MRESSQHIFSERTLIPVSLIGLIIFAVWWSTGIEKASLTNQRDIEQIRHTYSKFDAETSTSLYNMNERLNHIDRKLSRIEGLIESMQYQPQIKNPPNK